MCLCGRAMHSPTANLCVLKMLFNSFALEIWRRLDPFRLRPRLAGPALFRVDKRPEFAGRMLDKWAYLNKVELEFSRPGKPTDNALIEAFNSRLSCRWLTYASGSPIGESTTTRSGRIRRPKLDVERLCGRMKPGPKTG